MKHLIVGLFFLMFSNPAHSSSCSNSHLPKKNHVDYQRALNVLDLNEKFELTATEPNLIGEVGHENSANQMVQTRVWVLRALYEYPEDLEHAHFFLARMKDLSNLPDRAAWNLDSNWTGIAKNDLKRIARNLFDLTLLTYANGQPYLVLTDIHAVEPIARIFLIREDAFVASKEFSHDQFLQFQKEILRRIEIEKYRLLSGKAFRLAVRNEHSQAAWKRALNVIGSRHAVPPGDLKSLADQIGIHDYEPRNYRYGGRTDD